MSLPRYLSTQMKSPGVSKTLIYGSALKSILRCKPKTKPWFAQYIIETFTLDPAKIEEFFKLGARSFASPFSIESASAFRHGQSPFVKFSDSSWYKHCRTPVLPKSMMNRSLGSRIPTGHTSVSSTLLVRTAARIHDNVLNAQSCLSQEVYATRPTIVHLILVHASLGGNEALVKQILTTRPALSREYFEHLARFRIAPVRECYDLIVTSTYRSNMGRSNSAPTSEVKELKKWLNTLSQLIERYPEMRRDEVDPSRAMTLGNGRSSPSFASVSFSLEHFRLSPYTAEQVVSSWLPTLRRIIWQRERKARADAEAVKAEPEE
ncbi:Hypothetical predicted protein [Olea europaea subsp. europaea]|uniref:Uncharacterized protein n=1 Tax=Olea europaea subsp. europaea TaxID=158383 RepID=A0A8S0RC99_OLEEU|nr:Hypothetical predicted protein [Olea europaea subsp. europaea]